MKQFELTPQQRLDAYEWVLENYLNDKNNTYLCNVMLRYMFQINLTSFYIPNCFKLFPELLKQMPEEAVEGKAWWANDRMGNLQRELALTNAIEDVKLLLVEEDIMS